MTFSLLEMILIVLLYYTCTKHLPPKSCLKVDKYLNYIRMYWPLPFHYLQLAAQPYSKMAKRNIRYYEIFIFLWSNISSMNLMNYTSDYGVLTLKQESKIHYFEAVNLSFILASWQESISWSISIPVVYPVTKLYFFFHFKNNQIIFP